MKKIFTLKKVLTLERVMIVVVIITILAMIAVPKYIKNSRNLAARDQLMQIALAQMAIQHEGYSWIPIYAYTDGVNETAEAAIMKFADYGFRPDSSVAFHIMPPAAGEDGVTHNGFVAFAAHNSVDSILYVYDNISSSGVEKARECVKYGGITVTSTVGPLFRYKYDASSATARVIQIAGNPSCALDPNDAAPARIVVTIPAK